MSQAVAELNKETVLKLVCTALNILRAIELDLQQHKCVYQDRVSEATMNLCILMNLANKEEK